jgi:putative ABC transport system permease protein
MESLLGDVKFALRSLSKSPGFTVATVLTLALGIGANTAIFSLINGVLLRPLPYRDGERLVLLEQSAPKAGFDNLAFSIKEVYDYRGSNQTLSGLVEHHSMTFTLLGREEPERVSTGVVSAGFFDVLGVQPFLGRTFRPEDDDPGAEPVLVLSHGYWERSFGADRGILGRAFEMNDKPHTVVGVLPPIPQFPTEHDVYMPTSACPFRSGAEQRIHENRSAFRALTAFGRIDAGIDIDQVRTEFRSLAARFQRDYPDTYSPGGGYQVTAALLQEALTRNARTTLFVLLGTSILVLFIACANLTNLSIARMLRRDREIAVRSSLGAGRGRIIQQTLVEGALLSLAGAASGFAIAYFGLDMLVAFVARFTPRAVEIELDFWVLLFTITVAGLTTLVVGLLPSLAVKTNLAASLRDSGHTTGKKSRHRLRAVLIAAQVAIAVWLLVGAGLMLRSLMRLQQVDPGVSAENVVMARLSRNWTRYSDPEDQRRFFQRLLARVREIPGVTAAAAGSGRPLDGQPPFTTGFRIENVEIEEREMAPQVAPQVATPDYFRTMGIPLYLGRAVTENDHADADRVAVINQSLASQYWNRTDPIGARVSLDNGQSWITIVGVVGDVRQQGLDTAPVGAIYLPQAQSFWATTLAVRTQFDPIRVARQIKEAVYSVDPQQPVDRIETMEDVRRASVASPRLTAWLLGSFAVLALVISATGIAGVVAYNVSQRTQEIGIRVALGAGRAQVLSLVMRQGFLIVLLGLGLGLVGAAAASRIMANLLFETSPTDPLTFLAVLVVLLASAATACLVPARRAASVSPTVALRSE